MFRADNREAVEMRQKSTLEAMEDATQWLNGEGKVAVSSVAHTFRASLTSSFDLIKFIVVSEILWSLFSDNGWNKSKSELPSTAS